MESAGSLQNATIADCEMAIEMLSQGHDLMIQLQVLLTQMFPSGSLPDQFTSSLIEDVQKSIFSAVSILKGNHQEKGFNQDEQPVIHVRSNKGSGDQKIKYQKARVRNRAHMKRRNSHSCIKVTASPYYDGYQWRKYGQKVICDSVFPRSYYRCTYDQVCQATKQVQQINDNDPPMFLATYYQQHTCKDIKTAPHIIMESTIEDQQEIISIESYPVSVDTQQEQAWEHKMSSSDHLTSVSESSGLPPSIESYLVSVDMEQEQALEHKTSASDHLTFVGESSKPPQLQSSATSEVEDNLDYMIDFWLENYDTSMC